MISIIVPIYKAEKFLHRCIDSILSQTYQDWELLLIDDGSPDASGAICDEYAAKDSRINVFHKSNGGVSSARNLGLDNAKGEWITFVDADDTLEQDFLGAVIDDDEYDLILCAYKRTDGVQEHQPQRGVYNGQNEIIGFFEKNLLCLSLRTPWAKFFRRSLIGRLRFDETLYLGEDTLFCQKYYQLCKSVKVDDYRYYLYTTCNTAAKYSLNPDYVIYTFCKLQTVYRQWGINCVPYNNFLYGWFCGLIKDKAGIQNWYSNKHVRNFYMDRISASPRQILSFYKQWLLSYIK